MAKKIRVWDGTAWQDVVPSLPNPTVYAQISGGNTFSGNQIINASVGIGTSNPLNDIHIYKASGNSVIRAESAGTTGNDSGTLNLVGGSYNLQNIMYGAGGAYTISNGNAHYFGTSSASPVVFWTGGTERMRVDSSGRVTVGNTSALQNQNFLSIQNTTSAGMAPWEAATIVARDARSMAASVGGGIIFEGNYLTGGGMAAYGGIKGTKVNATSGNVEGYIDLWSRGGGGFRFYTSEQTVGSESAHPALQISTAGDTYLKGYNPTVKFTMSAYNDTSKQQIIMADNEVMKFYSLSPNGPSFFWYTGLASGGTAGATQSVSINPAGLGIGGANASSNTKFIIYGNDVSNPIQSVLQNANAGGSRYLLLGSGGGNAGALTWDNNNGRLSLDSLTTAPLLFRTNSTTAVWIDTSQNMLVGYTSSNGAYKLQVNSQIFATSSSIATSDGRYKENVLPITSGLDIIDSLNPVSFDWKEHPVHNFVPGKTVGFIAQEVKEALKDYEWVDNIIKTNNMEAVLDEEGNEITPAEEFLGIAESNIIPLLVAAVKELRAEVNTLKAQVNN